MHKIKQQQKEQLNGYNAANKWSPTISINAEHVQPPERLDKRPQDAVWPLRPPKKIVIRN